MSARILIISLFITMSLSACSGSNDSAESLNSGHDSDISGGNNGSNNISSGDLGNIKAGSAEELKEVIGDRVFFTFNSSVITNNGQKTLRRQAKWLKKLNSKITIEGHCDERGTREYNLALGERRANAVKSFLITLGVDSSRITTISYGKEHPEYLGSDETAWSKNRRAVTVISK